MKLNDKIKHSFFATLFVIFSLGVFCEPAVAAANESDVY